jgi:hypothetical protein
MNTKKIGSLMGLLFVFLTLVGCSTSEKENSTVILYDEWPSEGFPSDAAQISSVVLEENSLKLEVTYQGGCQQHTFKLYAWSAFLQSLPSQGIIYLSHDANKEECTEEIVRQLTFDLTPLDKERNVASEHPLLLRIFEPTGGSFATDPIMPLVEWP